MNSQIAKKRISDVIRVDTITSSRADFLATHVEVKNIQLTKSYDGKTEKILSEQEALNQYVFNPNNQHQLILVVGLSGTGKSHLIRWFSTRLDSIHAENEVVLFIRRSDNSLKGTIKQLLDLEEVAQIPNKDIYDRLVRASSVIDEKKLKSTIYHQFIVEIENDENDEILSNNKKKRLAALLKNDAFQARLLGDDLAIDRIYQKVAQSKNGDSRDVVALFNAKDFSVDEDFVESLVRDEAEKNARIMATSLSGDIEFQDVVASYMNTLVNNVIQSCTGLEPGDFEEVFKEIRRELKRQGKELTLLIEDITAFTGVNIALLNVISLPNTGMYEDLCRISSIIGTTTAYFEDVFPANYRDRVTNYMKISDEAFGADAGSLCEFVAKYLNAMSLPTSVLDDWVSNGADDSEYPIHDDKEGAKWDRVNIKGKKSLNLFPFTRTAIIKLFQLLPEHQQTPRYLLRDVVERVVRNYLSGPDVFPSMSVEKLESFPWNPYDHRTRLLQLVNEEEFKRMDLFIRIWGNANLNSTKDEAGNNYLSGIPAFCYSDLNMPLISGVDGGVEPTPPPQPGPGQGQGQGASPEPPEPPKPASADPNQVAFQLGIQTIYKWIEGGSLNFDSTKKDAKMMQQARDEMNRYIYNAINWQIEGISIDNISKFTSRDFIEFERQSKKVGKSLVMLNATPQTQNVLEAFVAYVTLGEGKTWSFKGGEWYQYQVQLWFERIKKEVVEKIKSFNGIDVDYQECAMSAELIRDIVFGQYKGTTLEGMTESLLWETELKKVPMNSSHSKEWISLMTSINDNSARIKDTILSYYNIIQGAGGKNKFLDHALIKTDFKKVIRRRLLMDESILAEKDPFKPRQDIRIIYRDIISKLDKVSAAEVTLASEKLEQLSLFIDYEDIDDEELLELVDTVEEFYSNANKAQVNVKYDQDIIDAVRKDVKPISNAISNVIKAVSLTDPIDILMAFSQDPLVRIDKLLMLLLKVNADIKYVTNDVAKRKEKIGEINNGSGAYSLQKKAIEDGLVMIEEWEAK